MSTQAKWLAAALCLPALLLSGAESRAEDASDVLFKVEAKVARERPTLRRPMKLNFRGERARLITPVFTREGLFATAPQKLWGLGRFPGDVSHEPVYDASSDKWFAWSNGMIVEVAPDGRLPVVVEDPPGHDFDIRAAHGLVVFRDPNKNEIVLMRLNTGERVVLHRGVQYFNPRFSPNGDKVVVGEDGSREGRLLVTDLATLKTEDVGAQDRGCRRRQPADLVSRRAHALLHGLRERRLQLHRVAPLRARSAPWRDDKALREPRGHRHTADHLQRRSQDRLL